MIRVIHITQEDIDGSEQYGTSDSAASKALTRAFHPYHAVFLMKDEIRVIKRNFERVTVKCPAPKRLTLWNRDFEYSKLIVEPIPMEIEIPGLDPYISSVIES